MRVTSSSETDIYSSITSAIGSLKGPLHGGANVRVLEMMENMKTHVKDWTSEQEVTEHLLKILNKKANDFSGKIGLADLLTKGNVALSSAALIAALVYWAIMIVVFAVVVDALGLRVAANILEKLSGYIPCVASSIFVAIVGMFFANLVSGVVKAAAANANLPRAEFLGSIAKGAILVFTTVVVLEELNIASFFVTTTFHIFFGALCLALALAFGLGGKDLAAKILWDFFNKQNMNK